jgi:hypothetical protein
MKFEPTNDKYMTAIVFTAEGKALKYHNIVNTTGKRDSSERFFRSKGGIYVNYYDKKSREFIERINLTVSES